MSGEISEAGRGLSTTARGHISALLVSVAYLAVFLLPMDSINRINNTKLANLPKFASSIQVKRFWLFLKQKY